MKRIVILFSPFRLCLSLLASMAIAYGGSPYASSSLDTGVGGNDVGQYGYDLASNRLTKTVVGDVAQVCRRA